jgi:hypothetical protein
VVFNDLKKAQSRSGFILAIKSFLELVLALGFWKCHNAFDQLKTSLAIGQERI